MSTFDIVCKASAGTGASAGAAASGATVETIGAKAAAVEHTTAARSWRAILTINLRGATGCAVGSDLISVVSRAMGGRRGAQLAQERCRIRSDERAAAEGQWLRCEGSAGLVAAAR
ncbi:unnamed protein product [Pelagomonas calceolata]|uniref:Uncharacterized protein n=1 Tax=Pelagomonas calceolata TaxID=35677 RepID=A0A8J2X7L6_9STRA|nr:unnamed protein product [Pelagomonas calceolata]|mmetsp:Transcript_17121/g.48834  ORF Transcript_17121/g.48834 Transcript_17121/m.48834 type:complete len:116 (+) Transcript_17121:203-550(+)